MKSFSRFLHRIAGWKLFMMCCVLYLLFPAYILKNAEQKIDALAGRKLGVIDLTIGFDPQRTLAMVAGYGDEARAYYAQTEMTADVAYPIVYAFLFGILLSMLYRHTTWKWVNVIPFVTMFADFSENVFIIYLLQQYPSQSVNVAAMLEIVKLFKWMSFAFMMLLVVVGLIMRIPGLQKINRVD